MRETGVYNWPNVHVIEGRWQDFLVGEKLGEVIELADGGFDAIFVDTFAEGYSDLKSFFEVIPDIIEPENGRFSFWNGLGATSKSCPNPLIQTLPSTPYHVVSLSFICKM